MTWAQRRYLWQVRACLRCGGALRRRVLRDLRAALQDAPERDTPALTARFGTPRAFAGNLEAALEPEQLARQRTRRAEGWIAALALAVLLLAGALAWQYLSGAVVRVVPPPAACSVGVDKTLPSG